jgi:hypothetical protein
MKKILWITFALVITISLHAQQKFDGLGVGLDNLYRLSNAKTRSISAENFTGEKGKGGMAKEGVASKASRDLGQGWKVNPYVIIEPGATFTLAEITGPGAIQHIWLTPTGNWRFSILRFYWDDEINPSVEVPLGDFFGMGWGEYAHLNSLAVTVNPGSAFNSYWVMPFRKKCKVTISIPKRLLFFIRLITRLLRCLKMLHIFTPSIAEPIRSSIRMFTQLRTTSKERGITLELIWHGVFTTMVGGARVKLSSTWMGIRNSLPLTEQERKIISAVHMISIQSKKMRRV